MPSESLWRHYRQGGYQRPIVDSIKEKPFLSHLFKFPTQYSRFIFVNVCPILKYQQGNFVAEEFFRQIALAHHMVGEQVIVSTNY